MILPSCKCCGQTLPRSAPFQKVNLTNQQYKIIERIKKAGPHGVTVEMLIAHVYSDDPNGGPLSAIKTVHTQICFLNKKLRTIGFRVDSNNCGRGSVYRIKQFGASP